MSEMPYVTCADGENLHIAPFYQQVFHHESSQPKTRPEYTLIKGFVQLPEQNRQVTLEAVSYTHLDVYKRQVYRLPSRTTTTSMNSLAYWVAQDPRPLRPRAYL